MLLLRSAGTLDLYRLSLVHQVYRAVAHDEISVVTGGRALRRIMREVRGETYRIRLLCTEGRVFADKDISLGDLDARWVHHIVVCLARGVLWKLCRRSSRWRNRPNLGLGFDPLYRSPQSLLEPV